MVFPSVSTTISEAVSSSVKELFPTAVAMTALPLALLNVTLTASSDSTTVSPVVVTLTVWDKVAVPAKNVSVPISVSSLPPLIA